MVRQKRAWLTMQMFMTFSRLFSISDSSTSKSALLHHGGGRRSPSGSAGSAGVAVGLALSC